MVSTLHTRRAVFGAMALAPVVMAVPAMAAMPATNRVEWEAGMRLFRTTLATAEATPPSEACDAAWSAHCDAQRALMAIPAPGRPELLWKVENLFDPDGSSIEWCAGYCYQLQRDARRLLGN